MVFLLLLLQPDEANPRFVALFVRSTSTCMCARVCSAMCMGLGAGLRYALTKNVLA